jgi:hypothetical protein
MSNSFMTLRDLDFEDIQIEAEDVATWESEDRFLDCGINLLREVAKIGAILSCIMPPAADGRGFGYWSRNQAILGGLLVRLSKLQNGFVVLSLKGLREVARLVFRSLFETAVNLVYMAEQRSDELYDRYVRYSLSTDILLLQRIEQNSNQRGYETPTEKRMIGSIKSLFQRSGVDISSVSPKDKQAWAGNLYDRAKALGYGEMYLATFSFPSHEVHGNWGDLVEHHLEWSPDGFLPDTETGSVRAYEILAAGLISADAYERYTSCSLTVSPDKEVVLARLKAYKHGLASLLPMFEKFIARGSRPE